jgi:excisionase family DNA binding protein
VQLGRSVSIDHAATLLNVSKRTIYNRIREGRLRTIRTLGGSQRILIESLHDIGFTSTVFSCSSSGAAFAPALALTGRFTRSTW